MSSNNSSTNSPPCTRGETPTTRDNDPSPTATEPALPLPATIGLEISPGGDEAPTTPAQIGADQDGVDAAINEPMELIERDEEAPAPPVHTALAHEEMESNIKNSVWQTQNEDVPMTPSQIVAGFEDMHQALKETTNDANSSGSGIGPPLPPSQMAELAEETREDDEEYGSKKKTAPTTKADDDTPSAPSLVMPPIAEEEETLQQAQDPPTPAVTQAPYPPPTDQCRSPFNPMVQQQLPIRPPPQSMMPSPDDDTHVSALLRDRSVPRLIATLVEDRVVEATLVEDQPEAIDIPDLPVHNVGQVAEQTWMEKYKKYTFVGLGIFLGGVAVAAGVAVSSNNGSSDRNTIEPERVVSSTARPSDSSSPSDYSSPSDVPSQRPTLRRSALPSKSSPPSQYPSVHPTLRPSHSAKPSQSPSRSLRPSLLPSASASPTPFCFGGEINILTDLHPEETSWTLSRIDNVDGVASSKVLLEGSPIKKGYLTSDEACLARGDYEFAIFDSWGDGIVSPGYYSVAFDGVVIAQGGNFESEDEVSFSLPIPSPPPSESSLPSELPTASFQPSESIVPSQSLRPSFRPSNSFSPSTYWSSLDWNRQGLGFNGDASEDFFGRAVAFSADASTMAIGAPGLLGNNDRPGYVKVYHREGEGSSWEQRGDTLRGEANGDYSGHSLALSEDGTILSVGAPLHNSVGPDSGQVKVYEWDQAALDYKQMGDTLYGASSNDEFGRSLDISNGKILAVGAPYNDANGSDSGQVTIYAWDDASSNFKQRGEAIDGDSAGDWFGFSVSLSGNGQKLAVGAPEGQVRVFEWDEATSNYEQLGDSLLGDAADDWFGWSVSFSHDGTALAIGAPYNDENGQWSGQVKVFAWDEAASNFEQIGQSLNGKAAYGNFGHSVALSSAGKTLAVGANQPVTDKPSYVEVYEWGESEAEYKRLGQSLDGEAPGDGFGWALALAGNGRGLAVGAWGNGRNGTASGRVEVFNIEL